MKEINSKNSKKENDKKSERNIIENSQSNKINNEVKKIESEEQEYLKDSKDSKYNNNENNKEYNLNNNNTIKLAPKEKTQEEKDEEEFKKKGVFELLKEGQIVKVLTGTRKYGNALQRLGVGTAVGAAAGCLCGAIGASLGASVLGMASTFGGAFTDIGVKSLIAGSILGNCFCIKSGSNKEKKTNEKKEVDNGPKKMTIEDYYKYLSTNYKTQKDKHFDVTIIDGSNKDIMTIPGSAVVVYGSDNIEINLNKIKFDKTNCKNSIYNKLYDLQNNINDKGGSLQTKLIKKEGNDICFDIDVDNFKEHNTRIKEFMSPIIEEDYKKNDQSSKKDNIFSSIYINYINNDSKEKIKQNNDKTNINNNSDEDREEQNKILLKKSLEEIEKGREYIIKTKTETKKKKIDAMEFIKNKV